MSKQLNSTSGGFSSSGPQKNDRADGLSASYLEARVLNLEENHARVCENVVPLKELIHGLSSAIDQMNKSCWRVGTDLSEGINGIEGIEASFQSAKQFGMELDRLKEGTFGSVNYDPNGIAKESTANMREKEFQPHIADDTPKYLMPAPIPTPPRSAGTLSAIQDELPLVQHLSLKDKQDWKPYHLTTLSPFSGPIPSDTVTFHPDFLANHLGGIPWSPGLRFVQGRGTCMLKNRTYYQIDPENEPYLPKEPGEHGAKLTAFFNKAPEEEFGHLFADDTSSYENVPMFVLVGERYMYYGNYSQTRWSDKLDHDTMATRVPDHVKNYWAEELTSPARDKWVTEDLKKHFFRKPEYAGHIFAAAGNETTVDSAEEAKLAEKMVKDVRKYVEELRQWDREASMKTAMIKKQSILDAFNASDMDEEPALRLWWEYLECVDWRKDFYDLLVTLQEREGQKYA